VQARLSFCTYFLLYPLVITLQDWSVNHVRNLKCQPCMEAAHLKKVVKVVAIVVGLFFTGLAYLQYQQIA
ncbi:MAG: hypothetical protein WBF33_17415, partial [Candidatus Nitrosopolaris sp.]